MANPKPSEHAASTLEEYIGYAEKALPPAAAEANWYRGQGQSHKFQLKPSLYRHTTITAPLDILRLENRLIEDFGRRAYFYLDRPLEADRLQQLFFMQHYGVPTRLLDWTLNPLMGLHFALTDAAYNADKKVYTEDAAVWILNPLEWNNKVFELRAVTPPNHVLAPNEASLDDWKPPASMEDQFLERVPMEPIAILGVSNSARIVAQQGVFTVYGRSTKPMDKIFQEKGFGPKCLVKIVIPKERIAYFKRIMPQMGYTESLAYPDLKGVAEEMKRVHEF